MASPFYDDIFVNNGNNVVLPEDDVFDDQLRRFSGQQKSGISLMECLSMTSSPKKLGPVTLATALKLSPPESKYDDNNNNNNKSIKQYNISTPTSTSTSLLSSMNDDSPDGYRKTVIKSENGEVFPVGVDDCFTNNVTGIHEPGSEYNTKGSVPCLHHSSNVLSLNIASSVISLKSKDDNEISNDAGIVEVNDYGISERNGQERDIQYVRKSLNVDGYKNGLEQGEPIGLQQGYNDGFHEGLEKGMRIGNIYGTLTAILKQLQQQKEAKQKANNILIASSLLEKLSSSSLNPSDSNNTSQSISRTDSTNVFKSSPSRSPNKSNSLNISNGKVYRTNYHDEDVSEEEIENSIHCCTSLIEEIHPFILNPNENLTESFYQNLNDFFLSIGYHNLYSEI